MKTGRLALFWLSAATTSWCGAIPALAAAPAAIPPALPLAAYGHLPSVDLIALSPDGSQFALVAGDATGQQLQVRMTSGSKVVAMASVGKAKLRSLQWAGDHHLLVTRSATSEVYGVAGPKREYSMALDFNLITRKMTALLDGTAGDNVEALNTIAATPVTRIIAGKAIAFVVGTTFQSSQGVFTLFRIDLDNNRTRQLVVGNGNTNEWLIDDIGNVAARVDYNESSGRWSLWTRRGKTLVRSTEETALVDTPSLEGFGRTAATVIIGQRVDDDWSYRELKLGEDHASAPIDELQSRSLVRDPKTGLVIGTEVQDGLNIEYKFLSPADQAQWDRVVRAFPKAVVRLESWSDDRRKMMLRVEGGTAGAAYYLLDVATKHASWLANEYVEIDPEDLGDKQSLTYPAADGLKIPAYLTLPPGKGSAKQLPLVVLAHGGPGARDEAGFDWWAQALATRGYAVLQPQFRGSTGFGNNFHAAGFGEWGRKMQTDLSDGVKYLADAGTIDRKRVCIVGASYGGYAALAGVTLQTGIYRCAVSLAGPADLRSMLAYEETTAGGSRNQTLRFWKRFIGAKSNSDPVLDTISPVKFASKVTVPVLLIHGADDTVVQFSQSKAMATALTRAGRPTEVVKLAEEDHWLSRSATRTAMLSAVGNFLNLNLPTDKP